MVLSTSALLLVGTFAMPFVPPSLTKNWLEQVSNNEEVLPSTCGSIENGPFLADIMPVSTITDVATHSLYHTSFTRSATVAQLDLYSSLEDGWDGDNSCAPSAQSVAFAKRLLDVIPPGISVPHPMISRDGTIGFYWSNEEAFADIEIDGNNSFSIFAQLRKGDEVERYMEDVPLNENTQQVLADCLLPLGRI